MLNCYHGFIHIQLQFWSDPCRACQSHLSLRCCDTCANGAHQTKGALDRIRAVRPGAGVTEGQGGQMVPAYPALFDGARIVRPVAPALGEPGVKTHRHQGSET